MVEVAKIRYVQSYKHLEIVQLFQSNLNHRYICLLNQERLLNL